MKIAVVDSGFRPGEKALLPINRVYEFCRRHRRFVFPSKGSSLPMIKPIVEVPIDIETDDGASKIYDLRLLRLDTSHWKAVVHERLGLDSDKPGCLHLNADADEDYRRQLVAEVAVRGPTGPSIWVPVQKANHYLYCEAMAAAAAFRVNVDYLRARPTPQRPISNRAAATPVAEVSTSARPARSQARRRSMGGWGRRLNR